jgi:hypothetical protein
MAAQSAHYESFAWQLTRQGIGQELRERYPVLQELPHRLVALANRLDATDAGEPRQMSQDTADDTPQEMPSGWLKTLDAIEGDHLLRACRKHLPGRTRRRAD